MRSKVTQWLPVWTLRRSVLVLGIATVAVLMGLRITTSLRPWPTSVAHEYVDGKGVVASVPAGGHAWLLGVRQGQESDRLDDPPLSEIVVDGVGVSIPDLWPARPWHTALGPAVLVLVSLGSLWLLPTMGGLLLTLTATLVVHDLLGWVTAPVASLAVLAPSVVAMTLMWDLDRGPRLLLLGAGAASGLIALAMTLAVDALDWRMAWWLTPVIAASTAVAAVAMGPGTRMIRGLRDRRSGRSLAVGLIGQSAVGRQAMRIVEEESRDSHSRWVHDDVMPRLPAASGDDRDPMVSLRHDLRNKIQEGQLAVLGWGGLGAALETAIGPLERAGIRCSMVIDDDGGRPPRMVEIAAWRVAQEALANVRTHASADHVSIELRISATRLRMDIIDDGVGLDMETLRMARQAGHIGVVSALERAAEVGAVASFRPASPFGTHVRFEWPR